MRSIILALSLLACTRPAPAPLVAPYQPVKVEPVKVEPPPPVNAVCEAFKGVNATAKCEPKFTAFGPLATHTAFVTLGETLIHCRYDASMTGVLCSDAIVLKQQPPPPVQDAPGAKQPAKKAAPKAK